MKIILGPRQCITSAPVDFDYGWMKTIIENLFVEVSISSKNLKTYRLAENDDDWHFEQQIMRYRSGLNHTIETQGDLDYAISAGWLELTHKPIYIQRATIDFGAPWDFEDEKLEFLRKLQDEVREIPEMKLQITGGGKGCEMEFRGLQEEFQKTLFLFAPFSVSMKTQLSGEFK